jgi:hypothetical protein
VAALRWTLTNAVSGVLVIDDPVNWKDTKLSLLRDERFHGVFDNFGLDEIQVTCGQGKEYIDNIYETQGINALIELLIEYDCEDDGTFATLFDGKVNLATYQTGVEKEVGEITSAKIERNDITQTFRNRSGVKVNLNSLTTLDGSVMNAYIFAPFAMRYRSQLIDLDSEIDGGVFTSTGVTWPVLVNPNVIVMQDAIPMVANDLAETVGNTDYSIVNPGLVAPNPMGGSPFHEASQEEIITYPVNYTVNFDISGNFLDCATVGGVRTVAFISLYIFAGPDGANPSTTFLVGNVGLGGYPTATICPAVLASPFNFVGAVPGGILMNKGDKIWLSWQILGYNAIIPSSVTFQVDYLTSEVILTTSTQMANTDLASFMIYEAWARVSESVTDQTTFAFKSDYFGRTDSEPAAGGAPTYLADGCGSLMAVASGLALRRYGSKKLNVPLPDFASLDELFDTCNAIYNVGLGLETHGGTDVIRVEDKAYFYDNALIIQLANVQNLTYRVDESRFFHEFEIGYAKWEPSEFDGLDEICTKQKYHLPVTPVKNTLTALSPYLAAGYVIEVIKRQFGNQKEDMTYDDDNFVTRVERSGPTVFISETFADYAAAINIDNPTSRYNLKISPKRNFLRWLNVLGTGIDKVVGNLIRFDYGEGNYIMDSQIAAGPYICDGYFNNVALIENVDLAWDNVNASLNAPLWRPEIWEFDYPLTFTQYQTIRAAPRGYIEFSTGNVTFTQGYILEIEFALRGGLSHFKLLRRP